MSLDFTNLNLNSNYILKHVNNEWCTPEDYGAVGDGVVDDTKAFEIALNTGKSIKCYKKEYKITGSLLIPSNQLIDLNGATIHIEGQNVFYITGKENIVIKNGKITGYTNASTFSIVINNSTYCHLDNIICEDVNSGFYFGSNSSYITTSNLKAINCRYQAFTHIGGANNIHHTNPSTYNACWGMNGGNCNNIEVVNGIFELGPMSSTPTGDETYYTDRYSNGPEHGIYFQNSNHIKIVNCIFRGWNFVGLDVAKSAGIKFRNGEDFQVIGGLVDDCYYMLSLPTENAPAPSNLYLYQKNVLIDGVVFMNCTKANPSILIWDKTGTDPLSVVIKNCVFRDDNAGLYLQRWSSNTESSICLDNCRFDIPLHILDNNSSVSYTYEGNMIIQNCLFNPSPEYSLQIKDAKGKKVISNNTFIESNTSNITPSNDQEETDIAYISLGNNAGSNYIVNNIFTDETCRRIGLNAPSGTIENVLIVNNVGGNDVFVGSSGTYNNNFMSNNTNYDNTVPTGITTAQNNKDLNNPTANY